MIPTGKQRLAIIDAADGRFTCRGSSFCRDCVLSKDLFNSSFCCYIVKRSRMKDRDKVFNHGKLCRNYIKNHPVLFTKEAIAVALLEELL